MLRVIKLCIKICAIEGVTHDSNILMGVIRDTNTVLLVVYKGRGFAFTRADINVYLRKNSDWGENFWGCLCRIVELYVFSMENICPRKLSCLLGAWFSEKHSPRWDVRFRENVF